MKQKLIINADDLGMSALFNKGSYELMDQGIVTSTTVMVWEKFIDVDDLKKRANISVGLHIVLEEKAKDEDYLIQIRRFEHIFGTLPSHFDGHQHFHIDPTNIETTIRVAKKFNIPVRSRFDEDRKVFQNAGIRTPDHYIGWGPSTPDEFYSKIGSTKAEVTEIVCHPGYTDPDCEYPYNDKREKELILLKSDEFKKAIDRFQMINYYEI